MSKCIKQAYQLDIGAREEQQDSCGIIKNKYSTFLILGDGMGGHKGGAIASQTLLREAKKAYMNEKSSIQNVKAFFDSIIKATVSSLQHYIEEHPDTDPQTTCVLALIQNDKVYSGHIGDSRLYIIDDNSYTYRTKDHSVVQMLVGLGEISEEEMATHPDQNRLLKSLNTKKDIDVTFKEIDLPTETPNAVLICSDGFWEYVSVDDMRENIFHYPLSEGIGKMINIAKEKGGSGGDNISVAVCLNEKKVESTAQKIKNFLNKEIF